MIQGKVIIASFYRQGNKGSKRLNNLLKVTWVKKVVRLGSWPRISATCETIPQTQAEGSLAHSFFVQELPTTCVDPILQGGLLLMLPILHVQSLTRTIQTGRIPSRRGCYTEQWPQWALWLGNSETRWEHLLRTEPTLGWNYNVLCRRG